MNRKRGVKKKSWIQRQHLRLWSWPIEAFVKEHWLGKIVGFSLVSHPGGLYLLALPSHHVQHFQLATFDFLWIQSWVGNDFSMEMSFDQHCCWFGRRHRGKDLSFPDERFGEQVLSKLEIDVIGVVRTRYWWSFPSQPQQVIRSVLQMVEQRQRKEQQSMSGVHFLPLTAHNTWEEDHCTHNKRRMQTVWRELGSRFFGHKLLLLLFFLFSFPSSFQVDDTESQVKHAKTNGHTREGKETTTKMDTTGQKGWQHNCLVKKEGGHFSVSHFFLSTSSTWLLLLPLSSHKIKCDAVGVGITEWSPEKLREMVWERNFSLPLSFFLLQKM